MLEMVGFGWNLFLNCSTCEENEWEKNKNIQNQNCRKVGGCSLSFMWTQTFLIEFFQDQLIWGFAVTLILQLVLRFNNCLNCFISQNGLLFFFLAVTFIDIKTVLS